MSVSPCHLLLQARKTKGKILDLLTAVKGEAFPLLSELLQRCSADPMVAEARGGDGVPSLLCCRLVGEGGANLWRHDGAQRLQRPPIRSSWNSTSPNSIASQICRACILTFISRPHSW